MMLLLSSAVAANAGGSCFEVIPRAEPPQHAGPPLPRHAVTNRAFTGIPSMAISPGGRFWATWYAGVTPGEDHNNYVVLSTSGDRGKTWKEVLVVDPDAGGPRRTFDPELWLAPDGKLRWFWADRSGGQSSTDGLWMIELADPDSEQTTWLRPVCVAEGVMMCKPLVLSSGEWVLPVCTWFTEDSSKMAVSTDSGKSWTIRGGATMPKEHRLFDEQMFVERKDGSIWLLARTKYGIGESVSRDRGKTWPALAPSSIQHPSARFFISRLVSGNLLLVKHGPINQRTGRSHLTAYLSTDDGKNWSGGLLLDERSGVSYPDGQQTSDGLIHIIYDYNRTTDRQILFAAFREEDVAAGKPVSVAVKLRQLVSQGSGGFKKPTPLSSANSK
jgi:predicted neuraminidase